MSRSLLIFGSAVAFTIVAINAPASANVLAGWYELSGAPNGGTFTNSADDAVSGLSGSELFGNDGTVDVWSSNDGFYGDDSGFSTGSGDSAANGTANGGTRMRINGNNGEGQIDVTVTNNRSGAVFLDDLRFDALSVDVEGDDPDRITSTDVVDVTYNSGDLSDPDGTSIGSVSGVDTRESTPSDANYEDYEDFGISLVATLSDATLGPGESATFRLTPRDVNDYTSLNESDGIPTVIDNVAVTGVIPEPGSLALLAPAGLLALRRRR